MSVDNGKLVLQKPFLPDRIGIRRDGALDNQLTEPIGCCDVDNSVVTGVGVDGEHHPRGRVVRADHLHHHDAQGTRQWVHAPVELVADGSLGELAGDALAPVQNHAVLTVDIEE